MYVISDTYDTSEAFSAIHAHVYDVNKIFREYVEEGFKLAEKKRTILNEKLKSVEKEGFEETEIFLQHDYEPLRIQNHLFESLFINGGVGYLYSQLDNLLLRIAANTRNLFQVGLALESYNNRCSTYNKAIQKPYHYLIDTFNIDFSSLDKAWSTILTFRKVRNHIIHHNKSYLEDRSFIDYIQTDPNLELYYKNLIVKKEYLIEMSLTIENFLNNLMKIIYETHKYKKKYSS